MKQKILSGLAALTLALVAAPTAISQPIPYWENVSSIICPPEIPPTIDAVSFANYGEFVVNITNFPPLNPSQGAIDPFQTFDTLYFTNAFGAFLACNTGFLMQNNPSQYGASQPAANFLNAGTINCGIIGMTNLAFVTSRGSATFTNPAPAVFVLTATNIACPGIVNMGPDSRLSFTGDNVDLTRGVVRVQNDGTNTVYGEPAFIGGIFDGYWGVGTNRFNPSLYFTGPVPQTFAHFVTNRGYVSFQQVLTASNAPVYFHQDVTAGGSNIFNRVVFLVNTNAGFPARVFFPADFGFPDLFNPDALPDIVLQWSAPVTNDVGNISTNFLYLFDSYAVDLANEFDPPAPLWPWLAPAGLGQTFVPINYLPFNPVNQVFFNNSFFALYPAYGFFLANSPLDFGPPASAGLLPGNLFPNATVPGSYAAYEGLFTPGSVVLSDVAGRSITNLPGRVDLTGNRQLDLTLAQITSVNTINLKATNNFVGSAGARIATPYADINLRSTNGLMTITNLIEPVIPHPNGICDLCSIRWTNLIPVGESLFITNGYHVVFVNARMSPQSSPLVQSLTLRSTNTVTHDDSIVIHDFMVVTTNLLLDTRRLTIATNDSAAANPVGGFDLQGTTILWSSATPRLQYLTNYGRIQAANSIFFGGSRRSPYYSSSYNEPYYVFVNRGGITNFSSQIWATNFQNSGIFSASSGSIQLQQARDSILTGGSFLAPVNLISIESASLLISNHTLRAGSSLTLSVTNYLDDGSLNIGADAVTNKNTWYAGYGINLPGLPSRASLLATTINSSSAPNTAVPNLWAGTNLGSVAAGYSNNAALGRLILDGAYNSAFVFRGPATNNALYVDYLECRNYATNFDQSGNLANLQFASGMKIYYAQLIINGVSWAEKLNGKNGGGLNWVPSYAGTFSSTNMVYPDGTTNRLNLALVQSCDLDSNNNGIANCMDPAPVLVPSQLTLAAVLSGGTNIVLTWNGVPFKRNYLELKRSNTATNWTPLTNIFVPGPECPLLQVMDRITNTVPQRFYRVRAEAAP